MSVEDFFTTTIEVQKAGAKTVHGTTDDTGATVFIQCRVEQGSNLVIKTEGHESRIDALLIMAADADIGREDLVTLDGEKMIIKFIGKERHGDGSVHHLEVGVAKQ